MAAANLRPRPISSNQIDENLDISDSDGDFSDEFEVSDFEEENRVALGEETDDETEEEEQLGLTLNSATVADPHWKKYLEIDPDFPRLPITVDRPGFQIINNRPTSELQFFQMFFTDQLLSQIVDETNRYAKLKIQLNTPLCRQSIWNSWIDVTLPEFKAYLGVIMNMALNNKPEIKQYFSEDWLDKIPFFKDVFSRTRFLQIHWALHLCPPENVQNITTRGNKVKNVATYINKKCCELFVPGQYIAVDESTVGFKGRVIFKCYNPNKPTKWGLRIYTLGDSATGYIVSFVPYYGSATTNSLIRPELPFTVRIVLHLCQTLLSSSKGTVFHLYTDRFYTSLALALELLKLGIHHTGTIMLNRKGLPKEIKKNMKLKLHEVVAYRYQDKAMVLVWKDKRQVVMLSTYHNKKIERVQRYAKTGEDAMIDKPTVICDYTKKMGAVDRADHYCASYAFTRKSVKWWRKMFFWLLEVGIVNSFILFNVCRKETNQKPVQHLRYRKELISQLVGDVRNKKTNRKRGRPSTQEKEDRLNGSLHFIYKNENGKSNDCKVCSNRKVAGGRKETVFYCNTCPHKPRLHPGECFEKYHTQKNFR